MPVDNNFVFAAFSDPDLPSKSHGLLDYAKARGLRRSKDPIFNDCLVKQGKMLLINISKYMRKLDEMSGKAA